MVPGPTNHLGESLDMKNRPLFDINHNPTRPPCNPIQPHKELLSFSFIRDNKIPSKNNPVSMLNISQKGRSNPIWTKLKIKACEIIAFFNPNWFLNSSNSQPRKISSSVNPIPIISNIEFIVISEDIFPVQKPHLFTNIGIKIRDIKIVDNNKPLRK